MGKEKPCGSTLETYVVVYSGMNSEIGHTATFQLSQPIFKEANYKLIIMVHLKLSYDKKPSFCNDNTLNKILNYGKIGKHAEKS